MKHITTDKSAIVIKHTSGDRTHTITYGPLGTQIKNGEIYTSTGDEGFKIHSPDTGEVHRILHGDLEATHQKLVEEVEGKEKPFEFDSGIFASILLDDQTHRFASTPPDLLKANETYGYDTGPVEPGDDDEYTIPLEFSLEIPEVNPSIEVDKEFFKWVDMNGNWRVDAGDKFIYNYKVTNTGDVVLFNLTLTDDLIGTITLNKSFLVPGGMATGTGEYELTWYDIRHGSVHNEAIAEGTTSFIFGGVTVEDQDVVWKFIPKIDLDKEFVKWIDNGNWKVDAGDKFVYSFKVTNTGEETLYNVMVTDPKISNIFGIDSTLAPGDMTTGYGVYVLKPWDIRKGVVHNKAFAKGEDADGLPAKDMDVEWKYIPKIDLDKEFVKWIDNGNWKVDAGDKFVYSFKSDQYG